MVDTGYWIECFPISKNDNVGHDLYSASSDAFPKAECTGDSVDQAVEKLQKKLRDIQKVYRENGMSLPRSHSLTSPTSKHRQERNWISVYVTLD